MRQTSGNPRKSLLLKVHKPNKSKTIDQSQAQIIAANFTRRRSRKEGLLRWKSSTQAPVFSAKASLNVPSNLRKKVARRKSTKYLLGELAVCPKASKKSPVVSLLRGRNASPLCKKVRPKETGQARKVLKQNSKRKRRAKVFDENDTSRIKNRVKYLLNRMNKEQNLIDAYSAEGWKGQSREKLRPERELQKAKTQILRFQLGIRDAMHKLDLLGLEGTMKEYVFNSDGQIYHEDIFCAVCKRQDVVVNNDIILCDGACDRAFHQLCLRPPLRTDEIPPDDEGWLCPVCDCKSDCLDAVNAYFGTSYTIEDPWKKIFAEAASFGSDDGNLPSVVEDWPSEDSEDADYVPGEENDNFKLSTKDQEGSSGESAALTSSDQSGSDSNASDTSDSRLSLLNELADIMESELGVDTKDNEISMDEEDVVLVDGKRQRKEVDYKKLHDEMFGKRTSLEEASEDEEWGPRKRLRKSKQPLQLFQSEENEVRVKGSSAGNSEKAVFIDSSPTLQNKQRRVFLSPHAVEKLRSAFKENPLPSRACKEGLSKQLGLSFGRVHVWFKNVRCAALKKGLIQRAKGRGRTFRGSSSSGKERHNLTTTKAENDPVTNYWLALLDMVNAAELKLETLRSRLQYAEAEGKDSGSLMYVAVAELKEKKEI